MGREKCFIVRIYFDNNSVEKITNCTSPVVDQILAELMKVGGKTLLSEVHKLIYSIYSMENLAKVVE
jgi:hypothetical protein